MRILLALTIALTSYSAQAGCKINLDAINPTGTKATVITDGTYKSKVKNKGGSYRSLKRGGWFDSYPAVRVHAGDTMSDTYNAAFNCNKNRRYEIYYYCGNTNSYSTRKRAYYPSRTGWTKSTNIKVHLFCN